MANKKISELQSRTPSLSDLLLVGDPSSGYSYKCTVTALATIIETDIADGYVTISTTQTISGAKTFSNNLALTSVSNANTDTDKFLVLNASNIVNFRTGAEVLSDIGGQGALTLTTTGSSGASTLVGNTLNIPTYTLSGLGGISGSGSTGYLPKFTGTTSIGNSIVQDNGSTLNIAGGVSATQFLGDFTRAEQSFQFKNINTAYSLTGYTTLQTNSVNPAFIFNYGDGVRVATFRYSAGSYTYTLPSATGTLALTSDITSSISGTTNYIPKFTGSNSIGNSNLQTDASGNLGLGVTPSAWGSAGNLQVRAIGSQVDGWNVINNAYDNAGWKYVSNGYANIYSQDAGRHIWYTAPSGTAGNAISFTQAMTLDASGRLGIGTTSPSYKLDVVGRTAITDANQVPLTINNTGQRYTQFDFLNNGTQKGSIWIDNTDASFNFYAVSGWSHIFSTNATERMRITSGGNTGIGTTSPKTKVDILSTGGTLPTLGTNPSSANLFLTDNGLWGMYFGLDNSTGKGYIQQMRNDGATSYPLLLQPVGGNVGIGTTSPDRTLTVNGSIGLNNDLVSTKGGQVFRIGYEAYTSTGGVNLFTEGAIPLVLGTGSAEDMRITSGGNVGIGTTSPGAKLEVNGAIKTSNPSGGTAKPWKLGEAVSTAVTLSGYAVVEIDGVAYKLALVTAN